MRARTWQCLALAVIATTSSALAGGMVLPVRGVRSLSRAGAFIAGADDAEALWHDPAGLAHLVGNGKRALLFDATFIYQTVEHTRIDSAGNLHPTVENQLPGRAIPTLAGALGVGDRLVIAGGLGAPYQAFHRYGDQGPQRYASVSITDATFAQITIGAAYKIDDRLRIGATLSNLVSRATVKLVVDGCPGATVCAPEDPAFDALVELEQVDYLAPSGSLGIQYDATDTVTLGLVAHAPALIGGEGELRFTPPRQAAFEDAVVVGDRGGLDLVALPPMIRAGVELRPRPDLRIELALGVELWSLHEDIVIAPRDIRVESPSLGSLPLAEMTIPRDYKTSFAPAIALEWHGPKVMFGGGYSYETAAAPASHVSVLTVDAAKHVVGIGGGYEDAGWQIGGAVGFALLADVETTLETAKVPQQRPLDDDQTAPGIANAGTYRSRYIVAGLRFTRAW
jgi:long-chain fatty acid transport protein